MPRTSNLGLYVTDNEAAEDNTNVRQWRELLSGNSSSGDGKSNMVIIDEAFKQISNKMSTIEKSIPSDEDINNKIAAYMDTLGKAEEESY